MSKHFSVLFLQKFHVVYEILYSKQDSKQVSLRMRLLL